MKKSIKHLAKNSVETKMIGVNLSKEVLKIEGQKGAIVVGLVGDLGGGKTTFTQGFAKGLGVKNKIISPTFVIFKKFQIKLPFQNFYHFDAYRLKEEKDLRVLGWEEIISSPQNIVLVEWANIVEKSMPKDAIWIKFNYIDKNKREIIFN